MGATDQRMTAFPVWLKCGEYSKLTTDSDCFCSHPCVRVCGLRDLLYVCVTGAALRGEFQNKT